MRALVRSAIQLSMVALAIPSSAALAEPELPESEAQTSWVVWSSDGQDLDEDWTDSWGGAEVDYRDVGMDLLMSGSTDPTGTTSVSSMITIGPEWNRGPEDRPFQRARMQSSFTYFFNIEGPAEVYVPIVVEGYSLYTNSGTPNSDFFASGSVTAGPAIDTEKFMTGHNDVTLECFSSAGVEPGCVRQPFSYQFSARGSDIGTVDHWLYDWKYNGLIEIGSHTEMEYPGSGYPSPASFGHILKAHVRIEDNFLAQHPGFSLSFQQVANQPLMSAVPEPATWAMLLGGFGAVGGAMRRRKAVLRPRTS